MEAQSVIELALAAKKAAHFLATTSVEQRTSLLLSMAVTLLAQRDLILAANAKDVAAAEGRLSAAMLDRLTLTPERFNSMVEGVRQVAASEDPVGQVLSHWRRDDGLDFEQVRVPLGVVAIIYESRPNVTADAAAICIRSGNVALLRGGSEALHSNRAIAAALTAACAASDMPTAVVSFLDSADRNAVNTLLGCEQYIDVVIPRGGESLIRAVTEQSKIPVLKHYKGVCHLYIDSEADLEKAMLVCRNAKVQRPGVCNALETLLVHASVAQMALPLLVKAMPEVVFHACPRSFPSLAAICPERVVASSDEDWSNEYLDLVLNVGVVDSVHSAIQHINRWGSKHTDGILTENTSTAERFAVAVDTGVLVINASTRFNDGGEFGKGAEIGISTDKLHARGPVGAQELTTYKYILRGDGHIRR